jgi:hypothetical protein
MVVSAGEDVATGVLVVAALSNPWIALIVFVLALLFSVGLLILLRRLMRRVGTSLGGDKRN